MNKISKNLTTEDLKAMYRLMLMSRKFTDRALTLYEQGRLPTAMHPSAGQEAIGVGVCYGLHAKDWVLPSLRTTEAFWTRGVTLLQMFNAMMGNIDSVSQGKESFHHSGYPKLGILAGSAIVGAQIPVSVGAAFALKMQKTDNVIICFFGDGAAARGDFHEGLNLAGVLNAPVVFVCENNLHFQTMPASVGQAVDDIADRAAGYGFPGYVVDGQDVLAVYDATQQAISRARRGEGPTLIECKTYRFYRHYPTLPENRDPDEIARWRQRDPIVILQKTLADLGYIDDVYINKLTATIEEDLDIAVETAQATPPPDPTDGFTQVYAESIKEMD